MFIDITIKPIITQKILIAAHTASIGPSVLRKPPGTNGQRGENVP